MAADALLGTLGESGIPAALAGGMAANAWVSPEKVRPTYDVDAAVLLPEGPSFSEEDFAARLSKRLGLACISSGSLELKKARIVRFFCAAKELTIDLVQADRAYSRRAISRAGTISVTGNRRTVLAPEDAILFKSLAGREKDIGPMSAIAEDQRLDRRYIERWARRLGTWRFVSRALKSSR